MTLVLLLLVAFAVTLVIGLLSGLVPALQAARRPIVDGLRQVG